MDITRRTYVVDNPGKKKIDETVRHETLTIELW